MTASIVYSGVTRAPGDEAHRPGSPKSACIWGQWLLVVAGVAAPMEANGQWGMVDCTSLRDTLMGTYYDDAGKYHSVVLTKDSIGWTGLEVGYWPDGSQHRIRSYRIGAEYYWPHYYNDQYHAGYDWEHSEHSTILLAWELWRMCGSPGGGSGGGGDPPLPDGGGGGAVAFSWYALPRRVTREIFVRDRRRSFV
jgi:hypothetical protein